MTGSSSEKLYGYAVVGYDHDRIARLNFRLTPGLGFGYQWIERPNFKFNTEAGLTFLYEDFENRSSDQKLTLRLAYHLTKDLNEKVSIFHNLEWLPAFRRPRGLCPYHRRGHSSQPDQEVFQRIQGRLQAQRSTRTGNAEG